MLIFLLEAQLLGKDVFFLTGTEEHGQKTHNAKSKKCRAKKFVDVISNQDKKKNKSFIRKINQIEKQKLISFKALVMVVMIRFKNLKTKNIT